MRVAIVASDGEVTNIIEAQGDFDPGPNNLTIPAEGAVAPGWRWNGEVFSAPVSELPRPEQVTDLQFRLALNALGLRDAAETIVKNGSQGLRDYWDRALAIHRDHPFIAEAANALRKSSTEIDDLFRLAATF